MLKRNKLKLLIVLILIFIVSCSIIEPKGELNGEVYIITKGRENIKLASVNLIFVPKNVIDRTITKNHIDSATHAIENAKKGFQKYSDKIDSIEYELRWIDSDFEMEDWEIEMEKNDLKLELSAANTFASAFLSRYYYYKNGTYFYELLKNNLNFDNYITTQTNSDGKYKVKIDKNKEYIVIASAKRDLVEETEKYCWLLHYNLENNRKDNLSLKNDNLFRSNPPNNIFDLSKIDSNWQNDYSL